MTTFNNNIFNEMYSLIIKECCNSMTFFEECAIEMQKLGDEDESCWKYSDISQEVAKKYFDSVELNLQFYLTQYGDVVIYPFGKDNPKMVLMETSLEMKKALLIILEKYIIDYNYDKCYNNCLVTKFHKSDFFFQNSEYKKKLFLEGWLTFQSNFTRWKKN